MDRTAANDTRFGQPGGAAGDQAGERGTQEVDLTHDARPGDHLDRHHEVAAFLERHWRGREDPT